MTSVLITANDTDVGKTHVASTLARLLTERGQSVRYVKIVETGVAPKGDGDAEAVAAELTAKQRTLLSTQTLFRFPDPIAPAQAAEKAGSPIGFNSILTAIQKLDAHQAQWLIFEGAGGIAVPLESAENPKDWADLAFAMCVHYTILVIENRLGAINQARLTSNYAQQKKLNAGFWLNKCSVNVPQMVSDSNTEALKAEATPLWATQDYKASHPEIHHAKWLKNES